MAASTQGQEAQGSANATQPIDQRIQNLEQTLQQVLGELESLKEERRQLRQQAEQEAQRAQQLEQRQKALLEEVASMREEPPPGRAMETDQSPNLPRGLKLGAYGEHHFNFVEGDGDKSDIHRFVGYVGYDFADWLHFTSETEIEHAFINDDDDSLGGDGDLILEQFYVDVNINQPLNFRVGRILHPAGIINRYHEPTTFYGVERPTFSKNVLPSTWSIDGAGFWGSITDWLSYEVYAHAGLDGSGFSGGSGIRGGRIKERPSFNDPGVSGRIDIHPLSALNVDSPIGWRTGFSYSYIGTENGDNGKDAGKPDGEVQILAFDTDLTWRDWEFRGEVAYIDNGAAGSTAVADSKEIFGAYGQIAYHWWPEAWSSGRLEESDAIVFVRYDYSDTQFGSVPGGPRIRTSSLKETTIGVAYYPVPNLVFKADYTFADSVGGDRNNRFDVGVGYAF